VLELLGEPAAQLALRHHRPVRASFAIINYNHGDFVGAAVESALLQTRAPDEVVVVDDGSTDDSLEVLGRFGPRVTVISQANAGPASATNRALAAVSGDVVLLLDADDIALPHRLDRVLAAYEENPEVDWVWHDLQHVGADGTTRLDTTPRQVGYSRGRHDHRADVVRGKLPITAPATSALSWRTDFLSELVPMPGSIRTQDNFLKFGSLGRGVGYVLDEALSLQRIHSTNAYTGAGARTERMRTQSYADMAPGLRRLGLDRLADRFDAAACVRQAFHRPFRAAHLDRLNSWGVVKHVPLEVARSVRDLLRR